MTGIPVEFTFDLQSLDTLESMTREGQYSSMGDCLRESLQIGQMMQNQARDGYTQCVVRNPRTREEVMIVIPRLRTYKNRRQK